MRIDHHREAKMTITFQDQKFIIFFISGPWYNGELNECNDILPNANFENPSN